ncbi:triokinase/FMN cyclase-like [Wyeomyia smithii]|uniref:triokinase/FMN cyclase-like n=1 Tax=Wyeomyia smithii TaxID=174621 RepID=UPI002467B3B3|nr:triokinase/FMN cyclase-like [Wyeomyia smithii]
MSLTEVGSSLAGFIEIHPGLKLLTDRNCVIRADNDPADGKVKLISGGGSGHEPAHIGYVGKGMLTGAVCGDIFSSPSVTAIVDCIKAVTTRGSCALLIVKNYTGDRLNFGIALEKVRAIAGLQDIRLLLVGDDCSIDECHIRKSVGRRGLAGVILVHKLLGAMAEMGCNIEDILAFGEGLVQCCNLATIGFTFELRDSQLENIEIGKGIHGEPGVYTMKACRDFNGIIDFILPKLLANVKQGSEILLLINNLGGTSEFLMGTFMNSLMSKMNSCYTVKRIHAGTFLSSLDQAGISVTILNLGYSSMLQELLDFQANVPVALFGKQVGDMLAKSSAIQCSLEEAFVPTNLNAMCAINESFGVKLTSTIIAYICGALVSCTVMLNTIDKEAGDGDTGSTIGKGATAILEHLNENKLDLLHPALLLQQISDILQQDMGGSSGALYSLFFQGASTVFTNMGEGQPSVSIRQWSQAISKGNDTIAKYALTEIGDRTMFDPLKAGERSLTEAINQNLPVLDCVESFTKACEETARATKLMQAKAGRASYAASMGSTSSVSYQHPDPGAHAVSIWARALFEACKQVIVT